jgi:hypothetical protein
MWVDISRSKYSIGNHVHRTKKRYVWKFELDAETYTLEMFNSVLSGKKKVMLNGRVMIETSKLSGAF